jgi:MFS family permease
MSLQHSPKASAARAIAAMIIHRYILKNLLIGLAIVLIIFIISLFLVFQFSGWWLFLSAVTLLMALFIGVITIIVQGIIAHIAPRTLRPHERKMVNSFVDDFSVKFIALRSIQRTPVGLALYLVFQFLKGGGKKKVSDIMLEPIHDIHDLRPRFNLIAELF